MCHTISVWHIHLPWELKSDFGPAAISRLPSGDNDPLRSDLENEERRARNIDAFLQHTSRTAIARTRTAIRRQELATRFVRSTRSRKTKLEENSRDKSACSGRRTTSRSIRPTKFNKLSGARAAAHKSAGMRPALIGRRNAVLLLRHAAEKTGKMRTPQ